ncbi:MAG: cytochrome b N-terminal domain-containing protein [Polyangiaceae bacterium]
MRPLRDLADFIDERTALRKSAAAWLDHAAIGGAPWAAAMAASVATCFGVLALTGVLLMTAYSPSPQTAWASVHYVQFVQERGWVVRGLHYWAAQALFVLAAVHVVYVAFAGAYNKPREIGWWLTLLVFGLAVAEGITGGLLPWDQLGWWARVVEGNIVGLAPVVGRWIEAMIGGGPELGALGLDRAYTAHVLLLPLVIALALWGRRALARRQGWTEARASPGDTYLRQVARNAVVALAVLFLVFGLAGWAHGAPLDGPADPMSDYPARPEWFLLPMFQLRKFFHGSMEFWGTSLIPGAAAGYLVLLPWIGRPPRSRAVALAPVVAIFGGAVALGLVAWRHGAHDAQYVKARAKADALAAAAARLAMNGVPPEGALAMVRHDPELHGQDLFSRHCASCHVLGDLGEEKKATATKLDGWGTPEWIASMIHDPDAPEHFGRGPFKGQMPSVDQRPKDVPAGQPWTPMIKSDAEKQAVALFLATQGDEPGDPPRAVDEKARALGEKIVSERCSTCHLYKGDGDEEGSGDAPELAHFGSVAWTRAQVANPSSVETYREKALSEELKKHMPRFDKELSPGDVDVVARWTRSHARAAR